MEYLLGIDLGTSSVRAMLMNKYGEIFGFDQEEYDIEIPLPNHAEQDPDIWWNATCKVIKGAVFNKGINLNDIKGVGLSGQMHGLVILDEANKPIRKSIIWSDQRTEQEVKFINHKIHEEGLGKFTLNQCSTGFACASLLWLKNNEPDNYSKISKIILPKDYIRLKLTGKVGTEVSDASGTLLFDTRNGTWSMELLDKLELDSNMLTECKMPFDIAGSVTSEASKATGLSQETLVVYGAADQSSQALGNCIYMPGTVSVTIGTGGQIFTPVNNPIFDSQYRTNTFLHALPNTWNIQGSTLSAGLSLKWLKNNILCLDSYSNMSELANQSIPGSNDLIFLPYLNGERTPHMDCNATGMFFGLRLQHNQSDIIKSVMEGVVYSLKDSLDIFSEFKLPINKIIASGGGAKSKCWRQIIADIFEKDVYISDAKEQACVGACILAGLGTKVIKSIDDFCKQTIQIESQPLEPINENSKKYRELIKKYREIYSSIKHVNNRYT